mmetsp:Transcript_90150/g.254239  ORF Transcript_90150/g.254239 Transcript_90150/m.254239 type:complete len:253 (-) Transcript_90150:118-876(-)
MLYTYQPNPWPPVLTQCVADSTCRMLLDVGNRRRKAYKGFLLHDGDDNPFAENHCPSKDAKAEGTQRSRKAERREMTVVQLEAMLKHGATTQKSASSGILAAVVASPQPMPLTPLWRRVRPRSLPRLDAPQVPVYPPPDGSLCPPAIGSCRSLVGRRCPLLRPALVRHTSLPTLSRGGMASLSSAAATPTQAVSVNEVEDVLSEPGAESLWHGRAVLEVMEDKAIIDNIASAVIFGMASEEVFRVLSSEYRP